MENINLFELSSTFEVASGGGTLVYPNASLVKETNQLHLLFSKPLYEWVDLGLPSGLKWAAWNVGATKPEEYGLYFAWGETEGYVGDSENRKILTADGKETNKKFSWTDYKWCNGTADTLTKYNNNSSYGTVDTLTTLEQVDDAAYQSDNSCRMPTKSDLEELTANTTSTWETLNGVNGRRFTSNENGNSIFVPAAGLCLNGSVANVGSYGLLWSSSLYESNPIYGWRLNFNSSNVRVNNLYRFDGQAVRPVKD